MHAFEYAILCCVLQLCYDGAAALAAFYIDTKVAHWCAVCVCEYVGLVRTDVRLQGTALSDYLIKT